MREMILCHRSHKVVTLLVIAGLLGACTANGNDNTTGDGVSFVIVSPTVSTGTPESSESLTVSNDQETREPESPPANEGTPPTLLVGTPQPGEPIDNDMPGDPAPSRSPSTLEPSNFDSDDDGFYTYDDLERAVEALLPTYEFPETYQVTPEMLLSGFADYKDGGGQWQVQYEYTLVGLHYLCAWGYTWLDAYQVGDTALMDESLDHFESELLNNPATVSARDDVLPMVERARLGDPAQLRQFLEQCDSMEFIATPSASTPKKPTDL